MQKVNLSYVNVSHGIEPWKLMSSYQVLDLLLGVVTWNRTTETNVVFVCVTIDENGSRSNVVFFLRSVYMLYCFVTVFRKIQIKKKIFC